MEGERAICDYEGTSYRARFWEGQGREYEDLAERKALRALLPQGGRRLLEVGAGFGRLADLYDGFEQVVLLDYARSGLQEAQERLGRSGRFIYVAADLYHLPLALATCDVVVTVRVLHHLVDVPAALSEIARVMRPGGTYVVEYANKRHLKAIARYLLRCQTDSPFSPKPYEFAYLNFDFHPAWIAQELRRAGFTVEAGRAVSHFRLPLLKRSVRPEHLAAADSMIQRPGAAWKLSPSVFLRATIPGGGEGPAGALFRCTACGGIYLSQDAGALACQECGVRWPIVDGIYDFKSSQLATRAEQSEVVT